MSYFPLPKNSFYGLLCVFISDMKVGGKLQYEDLQIKLDFRHGRLTFSGLIALYLKVVSGLFFAMLSVGSKYKELQIKFDFRQSSPIF